MSVDAGYILEKVTGRPRLEEVLPEARKFWAERVEGLSGKENIPEAYRKAVEAIFNFYTEMERKGADMEKMREMEVGLAALPNALLERMEQEEELSDFLGKEVRLLGHIAVNLSEKPLEEKDLEQYGEDSPFLIIISPKGEHIKLGELEALTLGKDIINFVEHMISWALKKSQGEVKKDLLVGSFLSSTGYTLSSLPPINSPLDSMRFLGSILAFVLGSSRIFLAGEKVGRLQTVSYDQERFLGVLKEVKGLFDERIKELTEGAER